jgi:hypothetical protein
MAARRSIDANRPFHKLAPSVRPTARGDFECNRDIGCVRMLTKMLDDELVATRWSRFASQALAGRSLHGWGAHHC